MPDDPPSIDRAAVAIALAALDREALVTSRWFGAKGRTIRAIDLEEAFLLDDEGRHVLTIVTLTLDDGTTDRYSIALTGRPLREARPGDGAWRALTVAMAEGRTIPALPKPATTHQGTSTTPGPVTAALVCRPAAAMPPAGELGTERDLGADQSNTGVVIGEDLLLKAYRRLQPGLNPDLEMTAFLAEEAGFSAVPPLAGFAELVEAANGGTATTIAMAQQFVADGADAFESIAEALVGWIRAPGTVSLEVATEIAADLGALTAGLHAALADGRGVPDMTPREAARAELRAWPQTARANLERALEVTEAGAGSTVRALAPAIAEALTVLDALPTSPELQRTHGDYHLGQVLIAPDGFRVIDFEGEPLSSPAERRALRHPLRDVASMLRSLDHVGRSAARRARARTGEGDATPDDAASTDGPATTEATATPDDAAPTDGPATTEATATPDDAARTDAAASPDDAAPTDAATTPDDAARTDAATTPAAAATPDDPEHVGLDVEAWIERARERFLEAYRDGLREARVWIDTDPDLLRAFEVDKELYEFAYAATYLPTWLYAPTEGMQALVGGSR